MSLDNKTINFMTNLIMREYFDKGNSFTSLDIANQAKEEGYVVRNIWVAEWLRSNVIRIAHEVGALYNQSLIRVDSKAAGITLAYLYHHWQTNPDTYLDRDQNPKNITPRNISAVSTKNTSARDVAVVLGITGAGDPSPSVVKQHEEAVSKKKGITSPQRKAVQRDLYGRFTSNPNAPVTKPTHFLKQRRDSRGKFTK